VALRITIVVAIFGLLTTYMFVPVTVMLPPPLYDTQLQPQNWANKQLITIYTYFMLAAAASIFILIMLLG